MPLIPENIIDEIQSRIDIAELIGRYIPIKRAGRHFKATCPFHKEKTPSFHINTEKQIFHCFGCGVGGNIFGFLMQQEKLTFPEAVRQLAEQAGISIPQDSDSNATVNKEKIFEILAKTGIYYQKMLSNIKEGKQAREYLKKRGLTENTVQVFQIGFAPAQGDRLIKAASKSNFAVRQLEEAGLITNTSRGISDRFRARLIFPIQDIRGRIIGFGGRSLQNQEPKYLNSPETFVYSKGRNLFGLFQAKDAISSAKHSIVVEGYFDCIFLWQAGIQNVVSPLGTAFTPDQAKLLSRYAKKVTLAFDSDAAGEAASLRGIDILIESGFEIRVAKLPPGIDPDEFVQRYGVKAFEELIDNSLRVLDFLIGCAEKKFTLKDTESRVKAAQFVLSTISKIPDAMLKAEYVRLLSNRLGLDEQAMMRELAKAPTRNLEPAKTLEKASVHIKNNESWLVAFILDDPSKLEELNRDFSISQMADSRLKNMLNALWSLYSIDKKNFSIAQFIARLEPQEALLASELIHLANTQPSQEEAFRSCLARFKEEIDKKQREQIEEQIRAAQNIGNEAEQTRLLRLKQEIDKKLHSKTKNNILGTTRREKVLA